MDEQNQYNMTESEKLDPQKSEQAVINQLSKEVVNSVPSMQPTLVSSQPVKGKRTHKLSFLLL